MMRIAPSFLILAVSGLLANAADEPKETKPVKARGVSFEIPKDWTQAKPKSAMRLAEVLVDPIKGDTDKSEMTLFAFPGGAGTVEANVDRWQKQFLDSEGNPPKITSETRKGKNTEVTFVETSGRYVAAMMPGQSGKNDKPGYHLLGAIVVAEDASYFFKMIGPDATMKAAKPEFEAMIKSIALDKK